MKKITALFFALAMSLSIAFIGGDLTGSSNSAGNPTVASAQVTVRKKRKPGVTRRVYRGGKHVATKIWTGSKWVAHKTWDGSKWIAHKSWKTGRKVVSRTKKVVY
jgi:hypothetical protein